MVKVNKKKKCGECSREVVDLPRHMRLVHKWSLSKSKSVNLIYGKRKPYTWRNGPPKRSKKVKSVADYHKKRSCAFVNCFSVTKRYDAHLKFVHGLDPSSEEYKDKLSEGFLVKDKLFSESIKEIRAARERDKIRIDCEAAGAIPDFREVGASENIYIAPSKSQLLIIEQNQTGKGSDNTEHIVMTNDEVLLRFEKFLLSVDGGKLDASTVRNAVRNIRNILKAIKSDDLSGLLDRMNIRNVFLAEYCETVGYAPLTIKKFLTSLVHFYDFLLNDELPMLNYNADDVLRMKVCNFDDFIWGFIQYTFFFYKHKGYKHIEARMLAEKQ